jgi:hypothetical protein
MVVSCAAFQVRSNIPDMECFFDLFPGEQWERAGFGQIGVIETVTSRNPNRSTQRRPPMKTIASALLALSFLAGAANASTPAPVKTDTVVEYGCGYGW